MKTNTILLFITLFIWSNSFCQDTETVVITEKTYDKLVAQARILDSINKEKIQKIGWLSIHKFNPAIYYHVSPAVKTSLKIDIDSVSVLVKDGYIVDINVYARDKQFTNRRATIPLITRRFSGNDYLENIFDRTEAILLRDFLQLTPTKYFIPEDFFVLLTKKKKQHMLKRDVGVNTIFDLRLYTDALALFGNEANGVAQVDGNFKQIIHRYNYANTGILTPGSYVKVNFNAAKFDSENKYVYTDKFSESQMLQKSFFSAEGALNVVSGWIVNKSLSSFFADFGVGLNSSNILNGTDEKTITFSNMFLEGGVCLKNSDNIGGNFSCRLTKLFNPQADDIEYQRNSAYFNFLSVKTEIYWSPFDDKASRLFARANYTTATNSFDKQNHFYQVQIGYSLLISDLIKK